MSSRLRILHLEDNPYDAELIKETLADYETPCEIFRVDSRKSFEEALERGGFDLILSDYQLPAFDGVAALVLAREKCPSVPYIFVSGNIGEESAIETLKNGATDYILKNGLLRLTSSVKRALKEVEIRNEHQQLEEKFRQSQKMEAVGRLAGGIAHDFNNLLTVISGYSEMLLGNLENKSAIQHGLEEIRKAAAQSSALTRQLLAFSRKQILEPKVLDLNEAIHHSSKMFGRIIGEQIHLELSLTKGLGKIKVDPSQLEQIMLNLIVNCRDAMMKGGKVVIRTMNVHLDEVYVKHYQDAKVGEYVLLSVEDSGIGMTEEVKKRIFEPFFTTKEEGKGTGLGLATVFGIVKQSNGTIEVDSIVGKGTTFKIYFPRVEGQVDVTEKKPVSQKQKNSETILLVEDETSVRTLTRRILEMNGYTVLEADGGEKAISICQEHQGDIHLLLTDSVMPNMTGDELSQRILKLRPTMKVLYVSGYADRIPDEKIVKESKMVFLQKPYTPSALAVKLREILD